LRRLPQLAAAAERTASRFHDLLLPLQARNIRSCARHGLCPPLSLKQALDVLDLAPGRHEAGLAKTALPLRILFREDVALEGAHALDLSRACNLEALLRALVCFHLHGNALISAPESSSLPCLPTGQRSRSCRCRRAGWRRGRALPAQAPGARPADRETSSSP